MEEKTKKSARLLWRFPLAEVRCRVRRCGELFYSVESMGLICMRTRQDANVERRHKENDEHGMPMNCPTE